MQYIFYFFFLAVPTLFLKQNEFVQSRKQGVKTKSNLQKFKSKSQRSEESNKNLTESEESKNSESPITDSQVGAVSSANIRDRKKTRRQITRSTPTVMKKNCKKPIDSAKSRSSMTAKEETKTDTTKAHRSPVPRKINSVSRRKVRFNFNILGRKPLGPRKSALKRILEPPIKQEHDEKVTKFEPKVVLERIFIPSEASTSKNTKNIYDAEDTAEDTSNDFDLRYLNRIFFSATKVTEIVFFVTIRFLRIFFRNS